MKAAFTLFSKGAPFRASKLDISSHINVRVMRDHTKRKVFAENEALRQALRHVVRNTTLPGRTRSSAQLRLAQLSSYTRSTQVKNRCTMSGRGKGVLSDFKMSRFNFRLQALAGRIPGVRKASW